ncbi:MAG: hypothetical protein RIR05_648 [Bacteroidota bacterium]|jgi:hypothetical protein
MESMDRSDWFIVAFIAGIFITGAITVFKFIFKK